MIIIRKANSLSTRRVIPLFLLLGLLLSHSSCQKEDDESSEHPINETEVCLAWVNGSFTEVELQQPPLYLDGGRDGFFADILFDISYPQEARENGIEGICEVEYEITPEGRVENIATIDDPGGGIGMETVRVIKLVTEGISFEPGVFAGAAVRVKKGVEVRFKLE